MAMQSILFAVTLALIPIAAVAEPNGWQRYAVPETGAAVDVPKAIFTEDAGKPESGYGKR